MVWTSLKQNKAINKGKIGEFLAAAFLTKSGYDVFFPYSYKSSCDLLVVKDNRIQTVEVKARSSFDINLPEKLNPSKYDLLVMVNLRTWAVQIRENPTTAQPLGTVLVKSEPEKPKDTVKRNYWGDPIIEEKPFDYFAEIDKHKNYTFKEEE